MDRHINLFDIEGQVKFFGEQTKKNVGRSNADVTITINQKSAGNRKFVFYFRNNKANEMPERIDIGIAYGCIIFRGNENGRYKIIPGSSDSIKRTAIDDFKNGETSILKDYCGDYDLLKDETTGDFYICKYAKLERR